MKVNRGINISGRLNWYVTFCLFQGFLKDINFTKKIPFISDYIAHVVNIKLTIGKL